MFETAFSCGCGKKAFVSLMFGCIYVYYGLDGWSPLKRVFMHSEVEALLET